MKGKMKKALSLLLMSSMLLSIPMSGSALEGEAEYTPAESNISGKYWVTSEASNGDAALALDGDMNTAWVAESAPATLDVDLGGSYNAVRKIITVFASSNTPNRYKIEGSADGENWTVLADRSDNQKLGDTFTDVFSFEGLRYVKLTVLSGKTIGVKEFEIINYLRSDMNNGSDTSEQGRNTNAYYYNAGNNPPVEGIRGGKFTDEGSIENGNNFFGLTKDLGWDTIRLRIWNEPKSENSGNPSEGDGNCSPENTRRVAKAIVGAGQDLAIDFHYSDSWSDPQNQPKPYAWAELSFDELVQQVYDFTYEMIESLIDQGTAPTIVALGNEITNGMLWGQEYDEITNFVHHHDYYNKGLHELNPGGGVKWLKYEEANGDTESAAYKEFLDSVENLACLVDAGNRAIQQLNEEHNLNIQTEMHFAFNVFEQPEGSNKVVLDEEEVFQKVQTLIGNLSNSLEEKGGMVDRIGISYYPDWHGTYDTVQRNIVELSKMLPGVKFNIAECSPKASGTVTDPLADPNHEVGFQYTIQSQGDDTMNIMKTINDVPNNVGMGVWPWAGTNVFGSGRGDNATLNASFKVWNDAFAKNVVESEISTVTATGTAPALPETVKSLDVATGTISDVTVDWEAIDASAYAQTGTFTVQGTANVTVPEEGRGKEMTAVTATVHVMDKVDASALQNIVNDAQSYLYLEDAYTAESFAVFKAAMDEAYALLDRELLVDWEEINAAIVNLQDAIDGLVPSKAVLAELLEEANSKDLELYTQETANALKEAILAAEAVMENQDATIEDVDTAIINLQTAIKNLVEVTPTDDPSDVPSTEQPDKENPGTGVSMPISLLTMAALCGLAGVVIAKKRRDQ